MKEKIKTIPNLASDSPAHLQALAAGNDHYRSWQFNVADQYKGMTIEEIKRSIKETSNSFAVCFEHWIGDFNLGTGIRNANAFNAQEVFYVGDKKWDRRSAVGVYNYTEVQWVPSIDEFKKLQERYVIIGIDNVPGSVPIETYSFPKNTLMVFGEEGTGLTPGMQALCKDIVHIEMFGTVRSLNCGVASGIAMYQYLSSRKLAAY
jgi:tRNA G18 (ribose-2'-O)-methylase SpoU